MKKNNQNKGITLIALIITVIVLLILAGVGIAALNGDEGLLKRAGDTKKYSEQASGEELIQIEVFGSYEKNGRSRYFGNVFQHPARSC
ncbi:MAG: hypothetical protein J6O41_06630 [Clostridia bacterium]|nr:hypothetical protein [Clostridia bacterium]